MSEEARKAPIVPAATVSYFGPGEHATGAVHGDLLLVRRAGIASALIRFGERLRNWGPDAPFARVNHAATIVSDGPTAALQEMMGGGGRLAGLRNYIDAAYALVHPTDSTAVQRALATAAARWYVGVDYGWPSIAGDGLYCLTGIPFGITIGQSVVCSADAASAQRCHGLVPDKPDPAVLPSDLARYYRVFLPTSFA